MLVKDTIAEFSDKKNRFIKYKHIRRKLIKFAQES